MNFVALKTNLCIVLCLSLLLYGCGCNSFESNQSDIATLNSDKITIYIDNREYENDMYEIINITNPDDIKILQNSVNFSKWKNAENDYNGVDYFYIIFNDELTIAMYNTVPYARIGKGVPDVLGNLENSKGYFDVPPEFLQSVNYMVNKYSE